MGGDQQTPGAPPCRMHEIGRAGFGAFGSTALDAVLRDAAVRDVMIAGVLAPA